VPSKTRSGTPVRRPPSSPTMRVPPPMPTRPAAP
jgi:hypothetical protein